MRDSDKEKDTERERNRGVLSSGSFHNTKLGQTKKHQGPHIGGRGPNIRRISISHQKEPGSQEEQPRGHPKGISQGDIPRGTAKGTSQGDIPKGSAKGTSQGDVAIAHGGLRPCCIATGSFPFNFP